MGIFSKDEIKPESLDDRLKRLTGEREQKLLARKALLADTDFSNADEVKRIDALDSELAALDRALALALDQKKALDEKAKREADIATAKHRKATARKLQSTIVQANAAATLAEQKIREGLATLGEWSSLNREIAALSGADAGAWPVGENSDGPMAEIVKHYAPIECRTLRQICPVRPNGDAPPDFAAVVAKRNQTVYDNFMKGIEND